MHPLNEQTSKRRTLILLLMAWLFAFLLAFPKLIVYKFTIIYDAAYGLKPYCMTKELELEWPPFMENLIQSNFTRNSSSLDQNDSIFE